MLSLQPQAVVALAQERVAGLHAVLQMAETGLETMPKLEDHAQVSGLRHTLQFRPLRNASCAGSMTTVLSGLGCIPTAEHAPRLCCMDEVLQPCC